MSISHQQSAAPQRLDLHGGTIAFDDTGGDGPLVVLLPGAGDIRREYRHIAPQLAAGGARVVTMDLRGHGDSSAAWPAYGVADTASDLVALLEHLDAGPATVVATSFSPTSAMWVAAERPELVSRLVAISAHIHDAPWWQRAALSLAVRGPLAGRVWAGQYRGWHPGSPPADLADHASVLATMLTDKARRRAVRATLLARRPGLAERMARLDLPVLVVMGGADSHFGDAKAAGEEIAAATNGSLVVIPGAGHYPQAEYPDMMVEAITAFIDGSAA